MSWRHRPSCPPAPAAPSHLSSQSWTSQPPPVTAWTRQDRTFYTSMFLTPQSLRDMLDKAFLHLSVSHTTITQGHVRQSISMFSPNSHPGTCWTKHIYTSLFFTPQSHKHMLGKAFLHFNVSHTTVTQGHVGQSISTLQCFSHHKHPGDMLDKVFLHFSVFSHHSHPGTYLAKHFYTLMFPHQSPGTYLA